MVSFADEQTRRRRQTWRYTAVCAALAAAVGMPLAMFISPLAYLVIVLGLRQIDGAGAVPAELWASLRAIAGVIPATMDAIGNVPDMGPIDTVRYVGARLGAAEYPFDSGLLTLLALVGPGMVATVLIWLGYRALLQRAGVGGMLLTLGAREPGDDLEERQIVNVIEEMALAGGLPVPAVRLLDSPLPNAVAIGTGPERATVIVTRGLLDTLDRDQTQGVIGHALASIGNGDLAIALSITTVFQTVELIFTAFDAVFNLSASAWRDLRAVAWCALTGGRSVAAAETVSRLFEHRIGESRDDGIFGVLQDSERDHPQRFLGRVIKRLPMLQAVLLPFLICYVLTLLLRMQVWLVRYCVVGPLLMRIWRTRRFLADATAVQLTRHPDGLASALRALGAAGAGVVPGGQWFSHLFVVGPEAGRAAGGRSKRFTEELGGAASHPGIAERVWRLQAQGAASVERERATERAVTPTARRRGTPLAAAGSVAGMVVVAPLLAIAGVLAAFAFSAIFMFGVFASLFFAAGAMSLLVPLMH